MKIKACRTAGNPGFEYFSTRESIPDDPFDMALDRFLRNVQLQK